MTTQKIKKGRVLLAEPFMLDPNFKRAVILLCEHEMDGSLGFILNKPLEMTVNELIADFPEFDAPVFYGGPVKTDTIHYIHNAGDLLEDSKRIGRGVYWGGNFVQLKTLIKSGLIESKDIRFFVGYSGWDFGQLEEEMKIRSWVVAHMNANYVFNNKVKMLWKDIMSNKGDAYSVIAQMPEIPISN